MMTDRHQAPAGCPEKAATRQLEARRGATPAFPDPVRPVRAGRRAEAPAPESQRAALAARGERTVARPPRGEPAMQGTEGRAPRPPASPLVGRQALRVKVMAEPR